MINGKFESQKEIYEALVTGKKIKIIGWRENSYMFMGENGNTYLQDMSRVDMRFCSPAEWSLYEEPKYEKGYRCLVRRAMRTIAHTEYRKDTSSNDVLKVYDDFILVDGDGKLVEGER